MWYIPTPGYYSYYSAIERSEVLTHATTQMIPDNIMLSDINQTQRTNIVTPLM